MINNPAPSYTLTVDEPIRLSSEDMALVEWQRALHACDPLNLLMRILSLEEDASLASR